MQSSHAANGFFMRLIATSRFPAYAGRVRLCCIAGTSAPLGSGLCQSATYTVPNEPVPRLLMIV